MLHLPRYGAYGLVACLLAASLANYEVLTIQDCLQKSIIAFLLITVATLQEKQVKQKTDLNADLYN